MDIETVEQFRGREFVVGGVGGARDIGNMPPTGIVRDERGRPCLPIAVTGEEIHGNHTHRRQLIMWWTLEAAAALLTTLNRTAHILGVNVALAGEVDQAGAAYRDYSHPEGP